MLENELPFCCEGGTWIVRDSQKRHREMTRRGFSPLARIAVCSKCGTTKFVDPGVPDEEFCRRRRFRQNRRNQHNSD